MAAFWYVTKFILFALLKGFFIGVVLRIVITLISKNPMTFKGAVNTGLVVGIINLIISLCVIFLR